MSAVDATTSCQPVEQHVPGTVSHVVPNGELLSDATRVQIGAAAAAEQEIAPPISAAGELGNVHPPPGANPAPQACSGSPQRNEVSSDPPPAAASAPPAAAGSATDSEKSEDPADDAPPSQAPTAAQPPGGASPHSLEYFPPGVNSSNPPTASEIAHVQDVLSRYRQHVKKLQSQSVSALKPAVTFA